MPYIHHSGNRYTYSENLEKLFEDLVKYPFENHPPTRAWEDEVRNRDSYYRRRDILDQGRANFDVPFKGLSPSDKVLIYCNHYMPMHLISSYHIFRVHTRFFTTHLTSAGNNVVFIDFGCGPLTSGIAFWAFARQSNIIYLGIDSSQAMRAKAQEVNHDMRIGPLPDWLQSLGQRLHQDCHMPAEPDQVIVNEYQPGQGISSHIDCEPCFENLIVSLSLGSSCVMDFTHKRDSTKKIPVWLAPRSIIVLRDESRYNWLHGIAPRKSDQLAGQTYERQRRVSLTFRKVIIGNASRR